MKLIFFTKIIFIMGIGVLLLVSCKKEKAAQVIVQIDYLGAGGYYNDNIDGVPGGLTIGENGPYPMESDRSYNIEYKADGNFPVLNQTINMSSKGTWKIHCYVDGNREYVTFLPE